MSFPSAKLRLALLAYGALWWVLLPVIIAYLWHRGRKDPLYKKYLSERFGLYNNPLQGAVWIHAVSLGEMRSATPLIKALLARGETIVTTHFTPAGRREAQREFATEIAEGRVRVVWVPFEYGFAYRRFLRAFTPKLGLVMEIEIWPRMIMACRRAQVPLFMCNAQYPRKSFEKDTKGLGLRAELLAGFAGGFVKSIGQRDRFAAAGMKNIHVTGELRFDQPIPDHHIAAAGALRDSLVRSRRAATLTSVVEGEDALYIDMIRNASDHFFVYVPRAPERFDEVAGMLKTAGISFARRSELLDDALRANGDIPDKFQVLLGDSMGEMYFYISVADCAIVGGGFVTKGAHNIIEPLALKRPVIVGPHIWTIEYPASEAIAAGVCRHVQSPQELATALHEIGHVTTSQIDAFYDDHAGAVERTLRAIDHVISIG